MLLSVRLDAVLHCGSDQLGSRHFVQHEKGHTPHSPLLNCERRTFTTSLPKHEDYTSSTKIMFHVPGAPAGPLPLAAAQGTLKLIPTTPPVGGESTEIVQCMQEKKNQNPHHSLILRCIYKNKPFQRLKEKVCSCISDGGPAADGGWTPGI